VRRDVPTCSLEDRVGAVRAKLEERGWAECVVVTAGRVVVGMVSNDTLGVDPATPIERVMEKSPRTFRPSYGIPALSYELRKQKLGRALVTTSDGALIGLVRLADVQPTLAKPGGTRR
jgi:CBS domain-containing protein